MNKPRFAKGLRSRLLLVLLLFLSISFLTAGWLSITNTTKGIDYNLNEQFKATTNNINNRLAIIRESAKILANRISLENRLAEALSGNNQNTIANLLSNQKDANTAGFMLLLDQNGNAIADNNQGTYTEHSFDYIDIFKDQLRTSIQKNALIVVDNTLFSISSATVPNIHRPSEPAGIILIGNPIDTALLEQIKGNSELEISIISKKGILASTINHTTQHPNQIEITQDTYKQLTKKSNKPIQATIFDTPYLNDLIPLANTVTTAEVHILLSYPQKRYHDAVGQIYRHIILFVITGTLIAIALVIWLFRDFIKSIKMLGAGAEKISRGDFKSRILINTGDELQILADTFNTMADTVESTNKTLSRYNYDLEREVEVRTRDYIKEERAHATSERKVKAIIDNIVVGLLTTDEHGNIETFNPAAEKMFGYHANEVIGSNISMLMPSPHSEAHDKYISDYINKEGRVAECKFEATGKRKDGSIFPHLVSISEMYLPGQSDNAEENTIHRYFIATMQDLSETKRTEEILRRAQKMEALGQLTGGIAHDFNNLLGIIVGNLDLLQDELEETSIKKHAESALRAALRGSDLTRRLLAFSRKSTPETQPLCINQIITDMQNMIEKSLTASISVQVSLDNDLWLTDINQGELEDAIINLAVNAKDAMPHGGKLYITTKNSTIDAAYAKNHTGAEMGEYVLISVRDTGSGIDDNIIEKVLDPFFTTKPGNKGSGLGLSMVYGFVKRVRGYINLKSNNLGTTVEIFLPKSRQKMSEHDLHAGTTQIQEGGNEVILLVDDEPDLAMIAEGILRKYGYQVFKASIASEAIDILEQHPEIDLLFSDVVMPGGMDGLALAQYTKQNYPQVKIILASGFTHKTNEQQYDLSGCTMLRKPYRKTELIEQIRKTLDLE